MNALIMATVICVVAVLVYMARYSGRLRVAQTRLIAAPIGAVYASVVDFCRWNEWNPWLEHDASAALSISGPSTAPHGSCTWDGPRIGAAQIQHAGMRAPLHIEQRLRFRQPFRFRGRVRWQFVDLDGRTEVTWGLRGRVGFAMRAFAPTVQAAIALDFRFGLDRLARLLEADGTPRYSIEYVGVREVAPARYAYLRHEGPLDGLGEAVREGVATLRRQLANLGIATAAAPVAIYQKTHMRLRTAVCRIGLPLGDAGGSGLPVADLPAHTAYVVRLRGSRSGLEVAWYQALQRMRIEGIEPDPRVMPFECWVIEAGPGRENDDVTELHVPARPSMAPQPMLPVAA
jgi:hypothetical protein